MDVMTLGVVGLGNWGKNIARSFSRTQGAALTYICDSNPRFVESQRALYPQATATCAYADLLEDKNLDAIILATPAPSHAKLGQLALASGKHLFVEKPMALSVAEAETLCATADAMGRQLMVGHLLEYHPAVTWMKNYLSSGELGTPRYIYTQRLNLGTVRADENALWSLAPHDISVILYLFGAEPDWVSAHGESYLQPGIADVVFAYLHFPDGRSAQIHVSWLDPHKERRMVLVGSQTMVVFDDMHPMEQIRIYNKGAVIPDSSETAQVTVRHGDVIIPHFPSGEPLILEAQHFVDALRQGTTPRSDGQDGWRVVRVLEAADQSLRRAGEPVKVEMRLPLGSQAAPPAGESPAEIHR